MTTMALVPPGLSDGAGRASLRIRPRGVGKFSPAPNSEACPIVEEIPIDALSSGVVIRNEGLDEEHVKTLFETPQPLPPIVVHRETMTVLDGAHRVAAARARGHKTIAAVFFEGSLSAGFVLALRLNSTHGLPLSRKDRRSAAERILQLHPAWSDRRVAAVAGVTHKTVAAVRGRSTGESTHSNVRIGRDGRARPLDATPRRRQAVELMLQQPDATIRQVAEATGLSLATVQDVRQRLPDGGGPARQEAGPGQPGGSRRTTAPQQSADTCDPGSVRPAAALSAAVPLEHLRADPSVRATIGGRTLIQLLSVHAKAFATDEQLLAAVPAHRKEQVADLARHLASSWSNFAREVERRHP